MFKRPRLTAITLFALALASLVLPARPAAAFEVLCFTETRHCIEGRFRQFWEQNGGLAVFGFPITDARDERNPDTGETYLTQWFERNRFELHPENGVPYDVLLGRLGDYNLQQQERSWFSFPKGDPSAPHYFGSTGHAIAEQFWGYWSSHGLELGDGGMSERESLALFGAPLSEPAVETNTSGDTVLTQWFERARFEYHPDKPEAYKVLLGLLGNEVREAPRVPEPCPDVPEPINGRIRPGKCFHYGDDFTFDIYGFQAGEQVGYWINDADGSVYGSRRTLTIRETEVDDLPFDVTEDMNPGIWSIVFQGVSSHNQSVIYFKVLGD